MKGYTWGDGWQNSLFFLKNETPHSRTELLKIFRSMVGNHIHNPKNEERKLGFSVFVNNIDVDSKAQTFDLNFSITLFWELTKDEAFCYFIDEKNFKPLWEPPKLIFKNGVEVESYEDSKISYKIVEDIKVKPFKKNFNKGQTF